MNQLRENQGRLCRLTEAGSKLYRVEIRALNDSVTKNGWRYDNLERHVCQFKDIPILISYPENGKVIGGGHDFQMRFDPDTGETYPSFTAADAERIVGWIPGNSEARIEIENGVRWIVVTGYLWRWYARELVDSIAGNSEGYDVSIETLIDRERAEGDITVEEEWQVLGITILGHGICPAVPGAGIRSLARLNLFRKSMEGPVNRADGYAAESARHTITKQNGGKMQFSNRFIAAVEKVYDGYRCVGFSDDRKNLALTDEDGNIYTCSGFEEGKETAAEPENPSGVSLSAACSDGTELELSYEQCVGFLQQRIDAFRAKTEDLMRSNEELRQRVGKMVSDENARRLNAAKAAVTDELERRNSNRSAEKQFPQSICSGLLKSIENGDYTRDVDENGLWTGERNVRSAVAALCMDEQSRQDAEDARRMRSCRSWSAFAQDSHPMNTVGERLGGAGN